MGVMDFELGRLQVEFGEDWDISSGSDGTVAVARDDGRKLAASGPAVLRVFLRDDLARRAQRSPALARALREDAAVGEAFRTVTGG
jgi:hypothetical protein